MQIIYDQVDFHPKSLRFGADLALSGAIYWPEL
jgi:hypothetical protein